MFNIHSYMCAKSYMTHYISPIAYFTCNMLHISYCMFYALHIYVDRYRDVDRYVDT